MQESAIKYNPFIMPSRVQQNKYDKFGSTQENIFQSELSQKQCKSIISQNREMNFKGERASQITQKTQEMGYLQTKHHASTILSYEEKRENRKKMKSAMFSNQTSLPQEESLKYQVQEKSKKDEQFLDLDDIFQIKQNYDISLDNQILFQSELDEQNQDQTTQKIEIFPENKKINENRGEILFELLSDQPIQSEEYLWQFDKSNEHTKSQLYEEKDLVFQDPSTQPFNFQIPIFYELQDQKQYQVQEIQTSQPTIKSSSLKDEETQTDVVENVAQFEIQAEFQFNSVVEKIVTKEIKKYKIYKPLKQWMQAKEKQLKIFKKNHQIQVKAAKGRMAEKK